MSKHTPGPWSVHRTPSGYDHIRGPRNQRISHEVSDLDDLGEEAKANAHLIAAAPEMLEALHYIAQAVTNAMNGPKDAETQATLRNLCGSKALQTIAKVASLKVIK